MFSSKKLALLLLLCASPVFATAPSLVQSASAFTTSTTTATATFGSAITAGNQVIVCGGGAATQNGVTLNTPTMTGETFTAWTGAAISTTNLGQAKCWATDSAVGGSTGVTLTTSAATDIHLHVLEVSGHGATPRNAQGVISSSTLSVSTSGATTVADALIIGFFFDDSNNRTLSAGTGYTQVRQTNNTTGGDAAISESKTVAATGTQTATASGNVGDTLQQVVLAVAGTAGGGGGATPAPQLMNMDVGMASMSIDYPALAAWQGCVVGDTACSMEVDLCDENKNCLHFPPGKHQATLQFVKNGTPTAVGSSSFAVTTQ